MIAMPPECPKCAHKFDALTQVRGPDHGAPRPGDFTICIGCGVILRFGSLGLSPVDELPAELDSGSRNALLCAQAFIRGRYCAQHDTAERRAYERTAEMAAIVVQSYLRDFPNEPPHFALGPEGIGIIAPLSALAGAICKDKGAWFIVKALQQMARDFDGLNEPTYMMLLIVLEREGVPFERVSLADLGIIEPDRRTGATCLKN